MTTWAKNAKKRYGRICDSGGRVDNAMRKYHKREGRWLHPIDNIFANPYGLPDIEGFYLLERGGDWLRVIPDVAASDCGDFYRIVDLTSTDPHQANRNPKCHHVWFLQH